MKPSFAVTVNAFSVLAEIDGSWTSADFKALLDVVEFGETADLTDSDAREMCLMSLQDLPPEEAASLLLRHRLGGRLKSGQIQNLASEMLDEKMWEEYADLALHEQMFAVGSLLYQAYPNIFPEPDAVEAKLTVTAINAAAKTLLSEPLSETCLIRLLAGGMDERSTLHRLFADQLRSGDFPQADAIVWIVRQKGLSADAAAISVISSGYWLDSLRETKSYECSAWPDED